jgi:putative FmdB family regulatory protein
MPLYDYSCQQCEGVFEALVMNGEAVECPTCHGREVKRLLSVPARPRAQDTSLPMRRAAKLPPCGPGCCRM